MIAKPAWLDDIPFAVEPPWRGLGDVPVRGRRVISFDTETFRFPVREMETASGRAKSYVRRLVPRMVCGTFAGVGTPPESARHLVERGLAILREEGRVWSLLANRKGTVAFLTWVLTSQDTVLATHSGAFDLAVAIQAGAPMRMIFEALATDRVIDVAIREKLFAVARGTMQEDDDGRGARFSLSDLVEIYLGIDRSNVKIGENIWRTRYHELDDVPLSEWPKDAISYALDDASDTLLVALAQAPLDTPRLGLDFHPYTTPDGGVINEAPQVRAAWALHLMSAWGMRVDPELYEQWGEEIESAILQAEEIARRAGFLRHNGTIDKKKLQEMIRADFEARGKEPPVTETGQISTTKEVLVECSRLKIEHERPDGTIEEVPVLKFWGETGFMRKMRSTYYAPAELGIDHAMLYSFDVLKATGRTSGRNPNLQNPPRAGVYRELFVPRPWHVFCSTDFSALELRTLGQIHYWWFGESALRDAFLAGEDPHEIFGAAIAGLDLQAFRKLPKPKYKMYRQLAKALNFGAPGGLGAEKLIAYAWATYGVDMYESAVASGFAEPAEGEDEQSDIAIRFTKHLIAMWKRTWPEAKRYMDLVGEACETAGAFTYIHPVTWRQRGGCTYTSGNNNGFQGLAADGAKDAAWRLCVMQYLPPEDAVAVLKAGGTVWAKATEADVAALCRALYNTRSVLFLHDEIIVEGPGKTAHVWGPAQGRVLVEAMETFTPDVPQIAEPALMRRWYKAAEPVHKDGLLVPWEPDSKS